METTLHNPIQIKVLLYVFYLSELSLLKPTKNCFYKSTLCTTLDNCFLFMFMLVHERTNVSLHHDRHDKTTNLTLLWRHRLSKYWEHFVPYKKLGDHPNKANNSTTACISINCVLITQDNPRTHCQHFSFELLFEKE